MRPLADYVVPFMPRGGRLPGMRRKGCSWKEWTCSDSWKKQGSPCTMEKGSNRERLAPLFDTHDPEGQALCFSRSCTAMPWPTHVPVVIAFGTSMYRTSLFRRNNHVYWRRRHKEKVHHPPHAKPESNCTRSRCSRSGTTNEWSLLPSLPPRFKVLLTYCCRL